MANTDTPRGFNAIKAKYGTAPERTKYTVKASTEIFENAPVCLNTTGELVAYTNTLALAGQLAGVASQYISTTDTDRTLYVFDDPNQLFEIQTSDTAITALTDYLGKVFRMTNATTGSATLLHSKAEIDGSTKTSILGTNSTTVHPVHVVGQSDQIGHSDNAAHSKFIVRFVPDFHWKGKPATGVT